jgi:hypothetical protein
MEGFNVETAQQAAARKQINQIFEGLVQQGVVAKTPSQILAEAPGLTATPSGVLAPRTLAPIPPAPSSALEQVAQSFKGMMAPAGRLIGKLTPLLSGYAIGSELTAAKQELGRPKSDPAIAGLAGLGALGGALSFTPLAPIGIPLSIASPMLREDLERLRQRALSLKMPPK